MLKLEKLILALFVALVLAACASSSTRFPDYGTVTQSKVPKLNVVLDTLIMQDLAGRDLGFDESINLDAANQAALVIQANLEAKGFQANLMSSTLGVSHILDPNRTYLLTQDWQASDLNYDRSLPENSANPFESDAARQFIRTLFEIGKRINLAKKIDQDAAIASVLAENEFPTEKVIFAENGAITSSLAALNENDSSVVLFVRVSSQRVKKSKFIGTTVLGVAASLALMGGSFALVPVGTFTRAEVVAYDPTRGKILWHSVASAEHLDGLKDSINSALKQHPYTDGERQFKKDRKLRYR